MTLKRRLLAFFVFVFFAEHASAASLNEGVLTVAAALGTLMISIQGLKWLMAESPKGRAEAKKGIVWTILGLTVAYIAVNLVCGIYCYALKQIYGTGITCGPPCE